MIMNEMPEVVLTENYASTGSTASEEIVGSTGSEAYNSFMC